jgi:hypothetical protein
MRIASRDAKQFVYSRNSASEDCITSMKRL